MSFEGIRRWLFGRKLDDPLFGRIRFHGSGTPWDGWEGEMDFSPTSDHIVVTVTAGEQGPTESHRSVYRRLIERWDELRGPLAQASRSEILRYYGAESILPQVMQSTSDDIILDRLELGLVGIEDVDPAKIRLEFVLRPGILASHAVLEHPLVVLLSDWEIVRVMFG